jgi:hypothetical protein
MLKVTIDHRDRQSTHWCEQCGYSPTTITVIRWAPPTEERPVSIPQQAHYFCRIHQPAAARMWQDLVDTARAPRHVSLPRS